MGFAARFFPHSKPGLEDERDGSRTGSGSGFAEDRKDNPADAPNTEASDSDWESIRSGNDGVKKAQATTIVWTRNVWSKTRLEP